MTFASIAAAIPAEETSWLIALILPTLVPNHILIAA